MTKKFLSILGLVIVATLAITVIATLRPQTANAFNNTYFDDGDSSSAASVLLVNTNTRYVQRSKMSVRIWFPRNDGSVTIFNGHWCASNTADTIETEDGSWGSFGNGANITKFSFPDYPGKTWWGKKNPSNCAASQTISFNNIPNGNTQNGYYYVDLDVSYDGNGGGGFDGVINYFSLRAEGQANARIGARDGATGYDATIEQINSTPRNTSYRIPFGSPCSLKDSRTATLTFFDLDNGGGSGAQLGGKVSIKLRIKGTTDYVSLHGIGKTWTPANRDNQTQSINFTAQKNKKYVLEINNVYYNNTFQYSIPFAQIFAEKCEDPPEEPEEPPEAIPRMVDVEPSIENLDSDIEAGETMRFNQKAIVTGFPAVKQWGWTEMSSRRAVNTGTSASQRTYDANRDAVAESGSGRILCANGTQYAANRTNCTGTGAGDANKWLCKDGTFDTSCGNYNWRCYWTNAGGNVKTDNIGWLPSAQTPGCAVYYYQCRNSAGNWTNSYRDFAGNSNNGCNNRYVCPSPSNNAGYDDPGINCKLFRCAYDTTSSNIFFEPDATSENGKHDANCQRRCNNGAGDRAPFHSEDDFRCFIQPSFTIRCQWSGAASGTTATQTVTGNGEYCKGNNSIVANSSVVADLCMTTRPTVGGFSSPTPGTGKGDDPTKRRANWTIVVDPTSDTDCGRVGAKPYMKVFNGDVQSGKHISYNAGTQVAQCVNGTGSITTYNKDTGTYDGSGTNAAVVAAGNIEGFRSGTTISQRGLTFANNNSAAVYGGSFGSFNAACSEYADVIKKATNYASGTLNATTINGNGLQQTGGTADNPIMTPIASPTPGTGGTFVHTGDLYISGDVKYNPGATTIAKLPQFRMIVLGNIYIDYNVSEIAGTYIAMSTGTGTGNIITCATTSGGVKAVPEEQRYTGNPINCRKKLTVNGSLKAKSVKYYRVFGTVRSSVNSESAASSQAAEVINYGPETWLPHGIIPSETGVKYDAITGLPPIL